MGRREQTTPLDPETEEARAQEAVDLLEGHKNTLQSEITALAENKKQFEADFADSKQKMESELVLAREEINAEKLRINGSNETFKRENKELKIQNEILKEAYTANTARLDGVEFIIQNDKKVKEQLESDIQSLKNTIESDSRKSKGLISEISLLEDRVGVLIRQTDEYEKRIAESSENLKKTQEHHAKSTLSLKEISSDKSEIETELAQLKSEIEIARTKISAVNDELFRAQGELASVKSEKQKLDTDTATKAGNLARLEARVEEKMIQLKEAETHFTTEHLARVGYQKLAV